MSLNKEIKLYIKSVGINRKTIFVLWISFDYVIPVITSKINRRIIITIISMVVCIYSIPPA